MQKAYTWYDGGFDSTYEGLKRLRGARTRRPLRRFDSTYEGLKRSQMVRRAPAQKRFDSTYEGLKRDTRKGPSWRPVWFRQYL